MRRYLSYILSITLLGLLLTFFACSKLDELDEDPDLSPLQQGFKASAAISYCASLAVQAFQGEDLPPNVTFSIGSNSEYSQSGILYVDASTDYPLPFNDHIGDVVIAGIWDDAQESGVISIIFGNLDIFGGEVKFYGLHTVPVKRKFDSERFITAFAQQDVVVGQGSDTLINVGLSRVEFDQEIERLDEEQPSDVFIAAQQNVWFIQFYQNDPTDVYDDGYEINGGGQIVGATNTSGGILYHAMIEAKYDLSNCSINPEHGTAFIQNIKAGDGVDLGNIMLDFHSECDGKADVTLATGKYIGSNGKAVNLHFN